MGYMRHNAIVVTSWSLDRLAIAHAKANELIPGLVTPIIKSRINSEGTFFVAPDGSKEGWEESDLGDQQRQALVDWMNAQRHEDNSTWLAWVEIAYGSDDRAASVECHAWQVPIIGG